MVDAIRTFHSSVDNQNYVLTKKGNILDFSKVGEGGQLIPMSSKRYTANTIERCLDSSKAFKYLDEGLNLPFGFSEIGRDGSVYITGKNFSMAGRMKGDKLVYLERLGANFTNPKEISALAKRFLGKVLEYVKYIK